MENFERFADFVNDKVGTPGVFVAALLAVLFWALSGPALHFSDSWQLCINTGTTIVTFLLVVLNANSSNRRDQRQHQELRELIREIHSGIHK